jgi:hypothetical protein
MTAEELLVERFLELERQAKDAKEAICNLEEEAAELREELEKYETLIAVLCSHLKNTPYGVSIDFKNYVEEDREDIEFLKDFFAISEDKEENAESM